MQDITIRRLGQQDYRQTWQAMQDFTLQRDAHSPDELWIVEHPPVFTLGLNGKREHLLNPGEIPVIASDRGGQVTYHGPGQLVVYVLLDIKRRKLGVRQLVTLLEQAVIATLAQYGIVSAARADAPGVYCGGKKIASIGLRIKKDCSYHGLSLNNDMDLAPFERINVCGYPGLQVTSLAEQNVRIGLHELAVPLIQTLCDSLP
ncbi:MAG: lipoyl(octanoyl) transferase LipB [Gammaproteobacteria bacterium]